MAMEASGRDFGVSDLQIPFGTLALYVVVLGAIATT